MASGWRAGACLRVAAAVAALIAVGAMVHFGLQAYRAIAMARILPPPPKPEAPPVKRPVERPKPPPPVPPPPERPRPVVLEWLKAHAITLELPTERRPLPEPLPEGKAQPGFKFRGMKGAAWAPEQYLAEIPTMAKYKMNFLMNCYLSVFTRRLPPLLNEWWLPLPADKREAFEKVVAACKENGIEFCFAMNPGFWSPRPMNYSSPKDVEDLWKHYEWMQGLGVRWFSICFDDLSQETQAKAHAGLVNEFLRRLRAKDPDAQMVMCPTVYAGEGGQYSTYLVTLAQALHPDVYCFWTGYYVWSTQVKRENAARFRKTVQHRLILWDNLCDEFDPLPMLGPVLHDPDLCEEVDGYIMNPHCAMNEINRIPMLTCADYTYNPWSYDPVRSIGQAILHLADTPDQQQVLKDLVETYPGRWFVQGIRAQFRSPLIKRFYDALPGDDHLLDAVEALWQVRDLAERLRTCFPNRFADMKATMDLHLKLMQDAYDYRCGCWPQGQGPPAVLW